MDNMNKQKIVVWDTNYEAPFWRSHDQWKSWYEISYPSYRVKSSEKWNSRDSDSSLHMQGALLLYN